MLVDTESKKEEIRPENKPYFFEYMDKDTTREYLVYIIIIFAIIIIRSFIVTPVRVNGTSMVPTLKDGEIMLLNKIDYRFHDIKRFDIVVVKTDDEKIIKRVIGLPGETLKYENDTLYIDGQEVKEEYTRKDTKDFNINDLGYKTIPQNSYFVMGDNRSNSKDSRIIGPVSRKQITGKASLVILPLKNKGYRK